MSAETQLCFYGWTLIWLLRLQKYKWRFFYKFLPQKNSIRLKEITIILLTVLTQLNNQQRYSPNVPILEIFCVLSKCRRKFGKQLRYMVIRILSWRETLYQYIAVFGRNVTVEWHSTRYIRRGQHRVIFVQRVWHFITIFNVLSFILRSCVFLETFFSLGNTISLCITYQILITPLVSSNSSYPIIIDVMSCKGQKVYKSCKVQSHTTTLLLIYFKQDISRIHNRNSTIHIYPLSEWNSLFRS